MLQFEKSCGGEDTTFLLEVGREFSGLFVVLSKLGQGDSVYPGLLGLSLV